jgi:hypothetical protein
MFFDASSLRELAVSYERDAERQASRVSLMIRAFDGAVSVIHRGTTL